MMRTSTAARFGKLMTAKAIAAGVDSLAVSQQVRSWMRKSAATVDTRVAGQVIHENMTKGDDA